MADDVVEMDGEIVMEPDDDELDENESDDDESDDDESDDDELHENELIDDDKSVVLDEYEDKLEESNNDSCLMCGGTHDPRLTLLCDKCDGAFHMDCLDPPLTEVPDGEWVCPKCTDPEKWEKISTLSETEEQLITLDIATRQEYQILMKRVGSYDKEAEEMQTDALKVQATLLKVVGVTQCSDADGSTPPKDEYWALHDETHWPQPLVAKLPEHGECPPEVKKLLKQMKELREKNLAFQAKKKDLKQTINQRLSDNLWLKNPKRAEEMVEELKKTIVNLENEINKKDGKRPAPHDEAASDGAVSDEDNAALALRFGLNAHGEGPSQSNKRPASPAPHGEGPAKTSKLAMVDPTGDSD